MNPEIVKTLEESTKLHLLDLESRLGRSKAMLIHLLAITKAGCLSAKVRAEFESSNTIATIGALAAKTICELGWPDVPVEDIQRELMDETDNLLKQMRSEYGELTEK